MTKEALKLALEALIDLGADDYEGFGDVLDALEEALAQPEQGYTTTRNAWTSQTTHKCNVCGRDDFQSEHSAKFHKCKASEEPYQHSQDRWLDIQLPDTTPPQRTWVGLTDEDDIDWDGGDLKSLIQAIETKLKEKNS